MPLRLLFAVCAFLLAGAACAEGIPAKRLIAGSEHDYPPFSTGNTDATADGFTVELWKAVAHDMGLDYVIRVKPFHELLQDFKEGRIDVLINLAQSEERSKFADFTVPHATVHGAIFIRKNSSGIRSEEDLANKSIIVVEADIAHEYLLRKGWGSNLIRVPAAADGLRLLATGRHDAMFVSKLVGMQTLRKLNLTTIVALPITAGSTQKFSFAVSKGNAELLALLNEGLALSKSNGTYAALHEKWFSPYEFKPPELLDALKYLLPLLAVFLAYVVMAYSRRHKERKQDMQRLAGSHLMLQTVIDTIPMRVYWKDKDSRYLGCNTPFARDAGAADAAGVIGKLDSELAWRDQAELRRTEDLQVMQSGQSRLACDETHNTPAGQQVFLRTSKVPLRSMDQTVVGLLGVYDDVTEAKHVQEEMQLASMVYENSSESMMVTDANGNIIAINPAFTRTTGYSQQDVIGKNARILNSGHHDKAFFQDMWETINRTGGWEGEIWDKRKNGEIYPKWLSINTAFAADGKPFRRIALFSDITEQKKSEKLIWQQANFDNLTGLPNRRMFHDRLEQEIKKAHRTDRQLALLFVDLDRFKEINDTLGHAKGDLLLIEAAQRLTGCVRESDTVARLGGDEFTIILSELEDPRGIDRIAQAILQSLTSQFFLEGEIAYVSASIGITLYPDDATHADQLIKNADQAMYEAKSQGRNRYSYFIRSMDEAAQAKMLLSKELHTALAEKQFWIAYQPIVELGSGNIHMAEALIRWQHPERGLVSPGDFIPTAEETGIIIQIGNWVFREAADQVAHWRAQHDPNFRISVNKSSVQFLNNNTITRGWFDLMREMKLPGQSLVVEIREDVLLHVSPIIEDKMAKFRNESMAVAIDDFGTGYSSLSYLRKYNIDFLKIDQSVVRTLAFSAEDRALCEAIIAMAHKLGIKVIAKGVETAEQRDLLMAAGCDLAQGFFFSRPIAAEQFGKLLGWHDQSPASTIPNDQAQA
ncbi:MAG: EAL domain-containing protein [Rhodocyclaceae bacterium]|nr:EAL domain-containing protein [Rhodocyclaceae bacterium]